MIPTTTTLADLVTRNQRTARVLERHGLDYCCGGGRTLAQACAREGAPLDDVLVELEALAPAPPADWAAMDPAALVDHIEEVHHRYLHDELARLEQLAEKVVSAHGSRHPELARVRELLGALHEDLRPHLAKEEQVLFPMIRELARAEQVPSFHCGSLRNPISVMLSEHDRAGELLAHLRTTTEVYRAPEDACTSYRVLYEALAALEADLHLHVHKENNVLFPAILSLEAERCADADPRTAEQAHR